MLCYIKNFVNDYKCGHCKYYGVFKVNTTDLWYKKYWNAFLGNAKRVAYLRW